MSLRANTYVALIGSAFLAIALIFAVTMYAGRAWIHSGERHVAESSMMSVHRAEGEEVVNLARTGQDWSSWDDMYRYVNDRNPTFERTNLFPDVLASLDVDAMMIVNRDGAEVVRLVEPLARQDARAVTDLEREIKPGGFVFSRGMQAQGLQGVIRIGASAMILSAEPILRSNGTGTPRGVLVMGRYLNARRVADLGVVAGVKMTPMPPNTPGIPARVRAEMLGANAAAPVAVDVKRPLDIVAYLRLDDVRGGPALVLRSPRPPLNYQTGTRVLAGLICVFLVGGLIWALLAVAIVNWTSISRIVWLRDSVASIGRRGDIASRIELSGGGESDEAWLVASGVNSMLDALERSHDRMARSEEHHRVLVESMTDAVLTTSPDGRFTFANARAEEMTGRPRAELIGAEHSSVLAPTFASKVEEALAEAESSHAPRSLEAEFVHADGSTFPVELSVSPVRSESGELVAVHWIARDATERKRFEDQLYHLASYDYLTGLFNRRRFEEEVARELAETRRNGRPGALLWIDVDHFKEINDDLGHPTGDEVLRHLALVIAGRTREEHVLARLGGDEFAVLVSPGEEAEALTVADRILKELSSTFVISGGHTVRVSASIGVALFPGHASTVDDLLLRADTAMYHAKETGRNRVCMYSHDEEGPQQTGSRREWVVRVENALAHDGFIAYAQPILDLAADRVCAYELLVRMKGEEGDVFAPGEFLWASEDLGLITEIDRFMVREAARFGAGFEPASSVSLFVNLSGKTLCDVAFPGFVESVLREAGAEPSHIGFELTEAALLSSMDSAREFIETMRHVGCRFVLDDFGSGFSSLSYLRHMPVDVLKIDGSLIREIASSDQGSHLVHAIIELARCLSIAVIAEHVENEQTLEILRDMNADYVQGYQIGRPVPASSVLAAATAAVAGGADR